MGLIEFSVAGRGTTTILITCALITATTTTPTIATTISVILPLCKGELEGVDTDQTRSTLPIPPLQREGVAQMAAHR